MQYAAALEGIAGQTLPPVETWNPPKTGEIDLVIKRDGAWWHEGAPIRRARLARLFSTVLRREGDGYFLVTPAEKFAIAVEDAPFVAVTLRVEGAGSSQSLVFTTNVGDVVTAGAAHALDFRTVDGDAGNSAPYLHIRAGLEARIARSIYYELVEIGETRDIDGVNMFGVWSGGLFFPFGHASEIDA